MTTVRNRDALAPVPSPHKVTGKPGTPPRLKVLVLDEYVPFPPDGGKPIRTWNLMRRIAPNHDITLICYVHASDWRISELEKHGIRVIPVPPLKQYAGLSLHARLFANLFSPDPYSIDKHFSRAFRSRLSQLLLAEDFDLLHCEWTPYAKYLQPYRHLPSVIATHNVESQIWYRRADQERNVVKKLFFLLQAKKMFRFERKQLVQVDCVATVSEPDARTIRAWGPTHIEVVDNAVDLEYFQAKEEQGNSNELLFVGSLDWFPNIDAIKWFMEKIFPFIKARIPDATFRIVGRRPPAELSEIAAHAPGVELTGEVQDVRPYVAKAAVVVVPLRIGGGSRIKILEALAMRKTVLSTSIGAEGLHVTDGTDISLADSPEDFAKQAVCLLNSFETRARLGAGGRKLVESRYDWGAMAKILERIWLHVANGGQRASNTRGRVNP